jgi:Acetyltransferases, including N-acetylases of ribosomal proteins
MRIRTVDDEIRLIPYYRNDEASLPWYSDPDVCRQVDNIDYVYDIETLHRMYDFLSTHGECYYIEYRGVLIGDVSLRNNAEIAIVVSKEYQNRHIGRKCVEEMLALAREKGMDAVKAEIYSFNEQSRRMFLAVGFVPRGGEWYEYRLSGRKTEENPNEKMV